MSRPAAHLDLLGVVAAVADAGGFTAAAARLGTTKTVLSQQVRKLEAELGGALFTRTTRRVTLTEAGERLLADCATPLRELEDAVQRFGSATARPTGTLRITSPPEYAADVLGPLLAELAALHPDLRVELLASAELQDLVAERIDVAVRFGWLRDSTLRATRLGSFEQLVVAAPSYLARAGTPKRPEELAAHAWVALTTLAAPLTLRFSGSGGRTREVRLRASLRSNSPQAVQGLVRGGGGIGVLTDFLAHDDLASGRLVRVLKGWQLPQGGIHAVYPATRQVPIKVRAFIDLARARLAGAPPREG